jgi:hypothetical protein
LRFSAIPGQIGFFDDVRFSNLAVPEPSTLALLGAGAFSLYAYRRGQRPI